ncbi:MAG: hypothetical protein DSY81_02905 [Bacillota bacterium]|nr:MAG: hypothetical protein DSY92_02660 [Planctomycetota bacterium]RUA10599.1 MAG: hypothetical protein DSY81_02905 [Bacillota bacterium]
MTAPGRRSLFERPVMVMMLLLTVIVVGAISLVSTPLQLFPPGFVDRTITVHIGVRESTPLEVAETIAEPAEELLRTIPGLSRIRSFSSSDGCSITVTISGDSHANEVYADIADRMERLKPSLPEGSDKYRIFRFDLETDVPIVSLGVTSNFDDDIEPLLENIVRPRLEAIEGVARVEIRGLVGKTVSIELDPDEVWAHSLDLGNLISRLQGESVEGSAGTVEDSGRKFVLRLGSRFDDLEALRQFPVTDSLRLGDIAEIGIKFGMRDFVVRLNGRLCNIIDISKESDANTVSVCNSIREVLDEQISSDPRIAGIEFADFFDQGKVITRSLTSLRDSCAWGGLLAVLILWFFMRKVSSTLIIAGAIPLSLLMAVIVIWAKGGTFNLLSLTGLTIGIGMLIDNAIVVSESIFRCSQVARKPADAISAGVSEVALAVTLATMTTVAVFVPLVFLAGDSNTRMMLGEFGLPVCYSIIASLLVALLFIPVGLRFSSAIVHRGTVKEWPLIGWYTRILSRVLDHRLACFWLLLLVLGTSSFPVRWLAVRSSASGPSHRVAVSVDFLDSNSLYDSDQTMEQVRQSYLAIANKWQVADTAAWFQRSGGTLAFFFTPGSQVDTAGFISELRSNNPRLPGVDISFSEGMGGQRSDSLRVVIKGPEAKQVAIISDQLEEILSATTGIAEVSTGGESSRTTNEVAVEVDRDQAERFGISPTRISRVVGWMLRGAPLPQAQIDGEDLPVWISYSEDETPTLGDLPGIPISNDRGGTLPLGSVASLSMSRTPPVIRREGREVSLSLALELEKETDLRSIEARIAPILEGFQMPEGYSAAIDGGMSQFQDDLSDMAQAGALAIVLIFALMGVLFESLLLPLSILCSIPFLFSGAFWALWVSGESLSTTGIAGFVILLGIVVNNAIVLVDAINRRREGGSSRREALLEAGRIRLRPILMTASTTICGLLPLVLLSADGMGPSYRPLGIVMLGGLTTSTLFTLIAVPLFYTLFDDLGEQLKKMLSSAKNRATSN